MSLKTAVPSLRPVYAPKGTKDVEGAFKMATDAVAQAGKDTFVLAEATIQLALTLIAKGQTDEAMAK